MKIQLIPPTERCRESFLRGLREFQHEGLLTLDDAHFIGNCAAGSPLSQADADFITRFVFTGEFASLRYDAATCTTTTLDAGAP